MNRDEWLREAAVWTDLTERQAEALFRRATGEGRQDAADAMDSSPSNVDNLERAARQKVMNARNLVALADVIGAVPDEAAPIGTCAECDEPTPTLKPDTSDDRPLDEHRMLCPACSPE